MRLPQWMKRGVKKFKVDACFTASNKPFVHSHTIVTVMKHEFSRGHFDSKGTHVSLIAMDCPVMPLKTVVTTRELAEGEEFDPHFSNKEVLARLPATDVGWGVAISIMHMREQPYSEIPVDTFPPRGC